MLYDAGIECGANSMPIRIAAELLDSGRLTRMVLLKIIAMQRRNVEFLGRACTTPIG
jgi:hypothetical protein